MSKPEEAMPRIFKLMKKEETRTVHHFQFTEWPNYGIPGSAGPIADFIQLVHQHAALNSSRSPELVIHCSGGVGRSGTFLAAYGAYSHFLNLAKNPGSVTTTPIEALDLTEIIISFRKQRHPWMVEGLDQYKMAYIIILHLLERLLDAE